MLTVGVQSIGKATKYLPPKIPKYNHPPTKKPRSGNINPEVHIALNFAATPNTGPSASAIPSQAIVPALTVEESLPARGSNNLVHTVNFVPAPGAGPSYPVAGQPSARPLSAPTPGETVPAGDINAPVHAIPQDTPSPNAMPPTQLETNHTSRLRIILDCRDASTVPSVLDLLTLMDQDQPTPDKNYVDALSEFYDFGVEDILDVFNLPCSLLASLGDLGRDRACQLHEYVRDKLLSPLGLLETGLKVEAGSESLVVKEEGEGSIIKVESQYSIIEVGSQHSIIEVEGVDDRSVVEVGGWHSVVGAGGDSSIVELIAAHTLPQAPAAKHEPTEYNTNGDESWREEDWSIKNEYEERILAWLTGVWEAGDNEEKKSDTSYEV